MTTLKLSSRGGVTTAICLQAVALVLITGILLAGCTGSKSSYDTVSQGSANDTLVQPSNAKDAKLADLHGTVEIKQATAIGLLLRPDKRSKAGKISAPELCRT